MNIGEAAKASGVSAKKIRYYEQIELIAAARRSDVGYRRYGEADVHTLRFIRRARDFGFSIDDITRLLALWHDRKRSRADVKEVALQHAADLRKKIAAMEDMLRALAHLARHCQGDSRPDCPILDDLTGTRGTTPPPAPTATTKPARQSRPGTAVRPVST